MSAFKQSMRKLGVRAGLLAGASAAVLAIAGIGAGSAIAAPTCTPEGTMIKGMGSSLQKVAQEVWTGRNVTSVTKSSEIPATGTANAFANSYREKCAATVTTPPSVTYGSSGSGPGLAAFRYTGSATEINHELAFVASDDGPSAAQITHAQEVSGTAKAVIVPVTQTAIAVVIHPPANCKFKSGKGITWTDLNKAFGGNGITKWEQFENIEATVAGACNVAVKRVVRAEGSGTTFQFKNYLATLEENEGAEGLPCTTEGHTKWAELREVGTEEKPNITWPKCAGSTEVITKAGGGAVAEYVASEAGVDSIGYAALPDAKGKGATTASLQNAEVTGEKKYASPANTSTENARCENARYTVPAGGRKGEAGGESIDWSAVFGAQPTIGGTEYPLCTLTYQIGWTNYEAAGYGAGSNATIGSIVKDYIKSYVVPTTEGQAAIAKHWYAALPSTEVEAQKFNVQGAAELAAEKLG